MRPVEHRLAARLQAHPRIYRFARRARTELGDLLPPRRVPGLGVVHRNDLMFIDDEDGIERYRRAGEEAAALCAAGLAAAGATEPPATVFDLGCGHGRCLRAFRARWPKARIIVADVDARAVRFCAKEFAADGKVLLPADTTLPGGDYDLLWAGSVLTHLPLDGASGLLAAVRAALAPTGVAVLTTLGANTVAELPVRTDRRAVVNGSIAADGMAFEPYRDGTAYGLTWFAGERFGDLAVAANLAVHSHQPRGWDGLQDVWVLRRGDPH